MENKVSKIILFTILVITFLLILIYNVLGISFSLLSYNKIIENRKDNPNLISKIKINGIDTGYDKKTNTYYYTLNENCENSKHVLKLSIKSGYKYKINNQITNVIKVDYSKPIKVIIYDKKNYYETKIQIINLPIVTINTNSELTKNYIDSNFSYISSLNAESIIKSNSKVHVRGATSADLTKKSYKIKMYNEDYTKNRNIRFSDLNYDDSFVLQSLYSDPSKIRNMLSTALWNDISTNFTSASIKSEFIELFINNEYKGLYALSNSVNRKNLGLNKSSIDDTSFVIKSSSISIENVDLNVDINTDYSNSFEMKYPNDERLFSKVWKNFYSLANNYYFSSDILVEDAIYKTFNINNYIDLVIFNSFTNNIDNDLIKNLYFYSNTLNNNKLLMYPWDMELSYGLVYNKDSKQRSIKALDTSRKLDISLYKDNMTEINKLIKKRYLELRKTVLTPEYFDTKIDSYKSLLTRGASYRDSKMWYEYDINKEIEDVRTWIHQRFDYFDEYVRSQDE